MSVFTMEFLSGSTNGRSVKVAATATAGTLIHTAHATAKDQVYIWANNTDTTRRKLTIEWGGVTAPDDTHEGYIEAEDGDYFVITGWVLSGGLIVRAFADTANVIILTGYVERIT